MILGNKAYITAFIRAKLLKQMVIFWMIITFAAGVLPFYAVDPPMARADGFSANRENWIAWAGLELFPAYLSADQALSRKTAADEKLHIAVIYAENQKRAEEMAESLKRRKTVKNIPVEITVASEKIFLKELYKNVAGAYISEKLNDITAVIEISSQKGLLLFSPYEDDVEKGVPAGLYISDRISPYLNLDAIQTYGIRLKSFFMRISETYDKTHR